ncbi:hypothetical protein [Azospirillum himalayense]|uniref:Uncharacterized protein n=1 Tax=Azospirillum himalayense TaxID=654847 RepID=A0ABW0FYS8_9PROT
MGDMTPEQRAEWLVGSLVDDFVINDVQSGEVERRIATAIRDAEERGRLAERERCAMWLDFYDGRGKRRAEAIRLGDHCAAAIREAGERESER